MRFPRIQGWIMVLVAGSFLVLPWHTAAETAQPLTREHVVASVLAQNPDLRMAAARLARAEILREKAKAAFYPQIGVYTEYSQGDAPSAYLFKTIDQRKLPANTDFNRPGWYQNWESGVRGQWNFFNGGRDWTRHRMAGADAAGAAAARREAINRLVAAAIQGYYDVLAAQDFAHIAEESVTTVTSQRNALAVRYRAGGALKSDLLSLEARLARAQEAALRATNQVRMSRSALAPLMGMDPSNPPELIASETPMVVPAPSTVAEGVRIALAQRGEVARLRHRVTQSNLAVRLARSGYLPKAHLQGQYYADDPKLAYASDRDNWTAAIVLEWALFSGFATQADSRGAAADLTAAMAEESKTVLAVKRDVTSAYLMLDNATKRLAVAKQGVKSAAASFALVRQQYNGGSATITRYLDAELDVNRAKIHQTAARYDREKALADLGRAIGHWPTQQRTQP